ncbi:MAG TPA: hypothetical protein DDW49_00170 [Deltaproteobacteria bacterium]|nr:hypothetical protein [Deltaproteobacteria bacterium]
MVCFSYPLKPMLTILRRLVKCFFVFFLLPACFGKVDSLGSIARYNNGLVHTEGNGLFRVGVLPTPWQKQRFKYRALLFQNTRTNSSISLDVFCNGAFDDAPLAALTSQLFYGFTEFKNLEQKIVGLDQREALYTRVSAKLDGVSLALETVVLKKDSCVYDFVHTSKPVNFEKDKVDFSKFWKNFHTLKSPGKK